MTHYTAAMRPLIHLILACSLLTFVVANAELAPSATTQVVLLGTGTPNADPLRSGPAVAIVVNDMPYLVDFGPGVVRQAAAMSPSYGGAIAGLEVDKLEHAFLTHLHSDHTTGLPDLILTSWHLAECVWLQIYDA
jgi:ribonuclease BN (tRNA processing enzyme)